VTSDRLELGGTVARTWVFPQLAASEHVFLGDSLGGESLRKMETRALHSRRQSSNELDLARETSKLESGPGSRIKLARRR